MAVATQPTFEDVGTPLHAVTFVVVDLETTGTSPATAAITEIGAVKVQGGEVLGELQTLVDPGTEVPAQISVLTGITSSMVRGAPRIEAVLPMFLEFLGDAVLVAHNASFDVSFLKAAAAAHGWPWPGNQVVDTVALARRAVARDEVRNYRLGTLAAHLGSRVVPDHRALTDARATVDVLHAILGRLGPLGVTHLEDLATAADAVPAARRRRRHLADGLPDAPGVYMFRDARGEVLYVGTATSIRRRVRSYFTAAEKRRRIEEMVGLADHVHPVVCGTVLEARVRELRLIAEHSPRYNRRSRFPERRPWVRLTDEPFPRLVVGRGLDARSAAGRAVHLGPFASRPSATLAVEAIEAAFALRRCPRRLPRVPAPGATSCALGEMGLCGAPCVDPAAAPGYAEVARAAAHAMHADPSPVVEHVTRRIDALVAQECFEEAATWRDRLDAFLRAAARTARSARLARQPELVAARRHTDGGWEVVVVRYGRLAASGRTPPGTDPRPNIDALRRTAEVVPEPVPPATSSHPEEAELLLAWLDEPGTRLVVVDEGWACPVRGAEAHLAPGESPAVRAARAARGDGARGGGHRSARGPHVPDVPDLRAARPEHETA